MPNINKLSGSCEAGESIGDPCSAAAVRHQEPVLTAVRHQEPVLAAGQSEEGAVQAAGGEGEGRLSGDPLRPEVKSNLRHEDFRQSSVRNALGTQCCQAENRKRNIKIRLLLDHISIK